MKIKIIANIPVDKNAKPIIGEIYEAEKVWSKSLRTEMYAIKVNGKDVLLYDREVQKILNHKS